MAIKFCTDCGKKVEYKFSPPKFCADCGTPMGIANANEAAPPRKVSKKIEVLNDDETDADSVPYISKLEYELDDFGAGVQQTLGSLGGKSAPSRRTRTVRDIDNL
jgi:hypothetical protein|tara:strand:+ start:547 stop:861 length:315 start_codon:yes stop_codon:yes gene_type:complete